MRFSKFAPHGLWLPLAFMAVCTVFPRLGAHALENIQLWAVCLVFFGILGMSPGKPTREEVASAAAIIIAVSVLAPALTCGVAILLRVDRVIRALMVLASCAPIAQSIGALAAILKLPDRGVALAALGSALLVPLVLPMADYLLGEDALPLSTQTLAFRAAYLVMAPAIGAFMLRFAMPARVTAWQADFRGLVILALSMFAAARGPGIRFGIGSPMQSLEFVLLAFVVTLCAMLAGWLLCMRFGRKVALSGTFATGMRSVPAAWAALGNSLDAEGTLFMTLTVVPFYVLPVLMGRLVNRFPPAGYGGHLLVRTGNLSDGSSAHF